MCISLTVRAIISFSWIRILLLIQSIENACVLNLHDLPAEEQRRRCFFFFFFLIQMKVSDAPGIGDSLEHFRLAHSDYSGKGTADIRVNFLHGHLEVHRKIQSS